MRHSKRIAGLMFIFASVAAIAAAPCYAQQPAGDSPVAAPAASAAAPAAAPTAAPVAAPEGAAATPPAEASKPVVESPIYYVATNGNDSWSGKLPEPNAEKTDGPFATLTAARDALRALRKSSKVEGTATVFMRGGVYLLKESFTIEPEDSGTTTAPTIFGAYQGEKPVISGGKTITGWTQQGNLWTVSIPELTTSDWRFHSIWVNGERRGMCRTPNEGFFATAGRAPATENASTGDKVLRSNVAFRFKAGDLKRCDNLDEALVVVLHAWETSFHHISSIDEENRIVTFRNAAQWAFEDWGPEQRYYVLNTPEGLDAPGEWYADRKTGTLSYFPMPGEDLSKADVVIPTLSQLVSVDGNPTGGQYVQNVKFRGITFCYANFAVGPEGYGDAQGAVGVPGAIQMRGAQYCSVEDCEVTHVDTYGIWLRAGSFGSHVSRNHIHDVGAGGVRVGEQQHSNDVLDVLHNKVDNNFIHDCGNVFRSGVGVWIGQSSLNTVSHNDISDLSNSAITVGWAWSSEQGYSNTNLIEYNRLHHVGRGEFSNMAGVYILGGSWNTIVRNNLIHDVEAYLYGGWGIHADEGSSNLNIENNIAYNTTSGGYDQFYGNLNRVQNNIFAFSRDSQVGLSNYQNPQPILFENNIVVTNNGQPFGLNWTMGNIWQDSNCYWDTEGWDVNFCGASFKEWQERGKDVHSVFADPMFEDIKSFNFRLKPESPVLALGFNPLDLSSAGLHGDAEWVAGPASLKQKETRLSLALGVRPVSEDFESLGPMDLPAGMNVFGTDEKASIKVTEKTAASGQKSLKISDSEGPQKEWQPEMCFIPRFRDKTVVCSFDIRLEPGAVVQHDWREDWTSIHMGPRLKFNESGELSVGEDKKALIQLPQSEWVHIEVECTLGKAAETPATFNLAVTVAGQETKRFEKLPCMFRKFRSAERVWFLSTAKKETAYYLDNVKIEQR